MKDKEQVRRGVATFLAAPAFAVVGVSADRKKFGNAVFQAMRKKGLRVVPVHPSLKSVEGELCHASVLAVPEDVKATVICVRPAVTRSVVQDCIRKGITSIWMTQGSESEEATAEAEKAGLNVVHGVCLLMYLEPVQSIHAVHRWVNRLVGAYPGRV